MGEVLDQIRRLDRTVRDLLEFARPATPSPQSQDLGESLRRAWSLLSPQPGAKSIGFSLEVPAALQVRADVQLLHQVWVNLYQNAIEAMPRGGELAVRAAATSTSVEVEVRDSGSGIEPSTMARLFKPFTTTKTRGTGLGLAIVKKIVEAHGGRIWAESDPGKRTSFFVEMPR
jgi:signal transduction histidine kinase